MIYEKEIDNQKLQKFEKIFFLPYKIILKAYQENLLSTKQKIPKETGMICVITLTCSLAS